ncbi:MAG: hypothetical protein AB3N28_14925 [Kordiimonas sp.]
MKYRATVSFLIAFFVSLSVAADDTLFFKRDEYGRLLIPVETATGESRFFQFDTASGRSAMLDVRAELYGVKTYEGGIRHLGSAGLRRVPVGSVRKLSVAGINRSNHIVALYPFRGHQDYNDPDIVAGSIGFDGFRGTVVHVTPQTNSMVLSANSGHLTRSKWGLLAGYPSSNASILVDFVYENIDFTLLIATGFSRSAINYSALKALKPEVKPKALRPKRQLTRGLDANEKDYGTLKLTNLDINGWRLGDLEVVAAPISSHEFLGFMDEPLLILGADVLTNMELVFDFRDFQLWYPLSTEGVVSLSEVNDR